jgi:CRP-like cAMP-binding protein
LSKQVEPHEPIRNRLLSVLPPEDYSRLAPHLEPVHLARGETLYVIGETIKHAYFPLSGIISMFSLTEDGATIESAVIGNEGLVGIPIALRDYQSPYQIIVQFPTDAMKIKADELGRESSRCGRFQDLLLRYTHALLTQVSRSATCNHFHSVKERLCRRLLTSRDLVKTDTLQLTQELLSQILGAPRTGVTLAIGELQREGVLHATRGRLQILDVRGLEANSCRCYGAFKEDMDRLFLD